MNCILHIYQEIFIQTFSKWKFNARMGEICKKYFYRKHWELPDKRIKNGGSSKDGILLKGALNSGTGHSWEQSVIVKSRKTVLGTVVEHKEHLTCETDNATLRAVSFLTVVQAAMSCLTHRLESSRLLCPWISQVRMLQWVSFPSPGDLPSARIKPTSTALLLGIWILYH